LKLLVFAPLVKRRLAVATQSIQFALDQGLKIFPVRRASKKPIIKGWPEHATNDHTIIEDWVKRYRDCNWGIVTGDVSNDVVIDIDGPEGRSSIADLEHKFGSLPRTLSVRTGRADGGQQLHFLNPQNREIHSSTKAIGEGVDVKGWHSLALIPDSIHPKTGRRYEWENHFDRVELPEPWAELIESTWLRKHPKKHETVSKENVSASAVAIVPELTHHDARHLGFRTLLPGYRTNGLLRSAGKLQRKGVPLDHITDLLLAENIQRCHPPLPVEKVLTLARDVFTRYAPVTEPDPLDLAWSRLNSCAAATTAFKIRALAIELQRLQPNSHILLPQKRLATLLDVNQPQVSHICRKLVSSGFMAKYSGYVPCEIAQGYRVSNNP
jgi:hypothetical protein